MCIDKYVPWAYQDSLFYLFQSLIRSYLNVRLNRHRHICWWWLWCMRAIVRARCVVRVLYNLSVDSAVLGSVVRSINRKADKYTHTVPTKSCVLRCAHTDTHQHTQFEDDRCLPCWPCYSLPSQHILLQDLCCPSLTLYSMSDIKRKKKESEKRKRKLLLKKTSADSIQQRWMTLLLFSPLFSPKSKWLISNASLLCNWMVNSARSTQDEVFPDFVECDSCVRERTIQIGFPKRH